MRHLLDINKQEGELEKIFEYIASGNAILFLGAGASIGEDGRTYLSKEIIDLYELYLGKEYNEKNITKFIDMISADPNISRKHFDDEVERYLRKYKVTKGHKTLASIPWREIITTNYDLLVEQAFDEIRSSSNHLSDLIPIRSLKNYSFKQANTEIKYIKLNGCISDKGQYPLAFSSTDFARLNKFYKVALNDLKNLSDKIIFISMGYSFSDEFGNQLIEKFDSYNYRDRKWIFNIDPFPNENALHYYTQQKVCIVKCSFQDFFHKYTEWRDKGLEALVKRKRITYTNSRESQIHIPYKLSLNLDGALKQLNSITTDKFIKDVDFYKGEEPNYGLIMRGVDVLKSDLFESSKEKIENVIKDEESKLIPLFFVTGGFGIGKSTFTLRLMYELLKNEDLDITAFEILDFQKLRVEDLVELLRTIKSKHVILFCDEVEVESSFKALLELQRELSIEQFTDINLFFIVPIRENILLKLKKNRDLKRSYELEITGDLTQDEISDLLDKLGRTDLVYFRDAAEKRQLIKKIQQEYQSDSFISLMELISDGRHVNDLLSAYGQLSEDAQRAFLYTAFLHKHKLLLPAAWLKNMISLSWEEFTERVLQKEGKGILFHEYHTSFGTTPDLFFRTKHPLIAAKLIEKIIPNKESQYKYYQRIINTVEVGQTNSLVVTNLLKSLLRSEEISKLKLDKLYDLAYNHLGENPYYLLNYAINLQHRKTLESLKKALDLLVYAESLLDYRNHKFLHRRGVINFEIAKLYFDQEDILNFTLSHLQEAKELFITKQLLDPFSAYSYVDYIKLLIWELKNIEFGEEEELQGRIHVEELFDLANKTVTDGINRIHSEEVFYAEYLKGVTDNQSYKQYLDELYENSNLRPYACVLLYNYYERDADGSYSEELDELLDEMLAYKDNPEVVKFLFKYFGRNLHITNNRIALFNLCSENQFLEKDNPLRVHYFSFIAESYNHRFSDGRNHLSQITSKYNTLNPEFHYVWKDNNGDEEIFSGQVVRDRYRKFKIIKIPTLQQTFTLVKGNYDNYDVNEMVNVKLHFYLYGIKAEIVENKLRAEAALQNSSTVLGENS